MMRLGVLFIGLTGLLACAEVRDRSEDSHDMVDLPMDSPAMLFNEVLASNDNDAPVIRDAYGEAEDALELYNLTEDALDLEGWRIDIDDGAADYTFPPEARLAAGGHLVLWCDGETEAQQDVVLGRFHANFKIAKEGATLELFTPDGQRADEVRWGEGEDAPFEPQRTNISLARETDGGEPWLASDPPTMGASNN